MLRRVKRELQRHYGRIIKRNPVNPFKDQKQQARAGDIDLGLLAPAVSRYHFEG